MRVIDKAAGGHLDSRRRRQQRGPKETGNREVESTWVGVEVVNAQAGVRTYG